MQPAAAGNTVVNVTLTDDSKIHKTLTILDAHHPLDVEESSEETTGSATGVSAETEPGSLQAAVWRRVQQLA